MKGLPDGPCMCPMECVWVRLPEGTPCEGLARRQDAASGGSIPPLALKYGKLAEMDECTRLLTGRGESLRGFESLTFRQCRGRA